MNYRFEKITPFSIVWIPGNIRWEHGIHCLPCYDTNLVIDLWQSVTLSILTEWRPDDMSLTSICILSCYGNRYMAPSVSGHGQQCFDNNTNGNSSNRKFRFSQTNNNYSWKSSKSVLLIRNIRLVRIHQSSESTYIRGFDSIGRNNVGVLGKFLKQNK